MPATDPNKGPDYDSSVFINCPFDESFTPLLRALVYAMVTCGYRPRIATERDDAGEQRLSKICELISECRYSIHDLSRYKSTTAGEFYRLNMPFELGVDYGSRVFHASTYGNKQFLILSSDRYSYKGALSDLAGVDGKSHGNDPKILIRRVRNWITVATERKDVPGPSKIWYELAEFDAYLLDKLLELGFSEDDIREMPIVEYIAHAEAWLEDRGSAP